jgi:ferritin-like metal-binding protein YciE
MAKVDSLEALLIDELRDLLDVETQLTKTLPKLAKAATSDDLREAFEEHLAETEEHVERLNRAFKSLGMPAKAKKCAGIRGIIEEGDEMKSEADGESVVDAALIAAAQKAEHYEIATYGTVLTHARLLGHDDVVAELEETLDEEKAADTKLTEIAESHINVEAAGEDSEEATQRGGRGRGTRALVAAKSRQTRGRSHNGARAR